MRKKILLASVSSGLGLFLMACASTPADKNLSFESREGYLDRVSGQLDSLEQRLSSANNVPEMSKLMEARREYRQLKVTSNTNWNRQKSQLEATLTDLGVNPVAAE